MRIEECTEVLQNMRAPRNSGKDELSGHEHVPLKIGLGCGMV